MDYQAFLTSSSTIPLAYRILVSSPTSEPSSVQEVQVNLTQGWECRYRMHKPLQWDLSDNSYRGRMNQLFHAVAHHRSPE